MKIILALLLFFVPTALGQFRFAWLSDTHIGFPTAAGDLRAVVVDINGRDDLKFAVVSGDITEKGKNEELRLAKQILDSLAIPYLIVPGNHDTKWSESGCSLFPALFGDDKFAHVFGDYTVLGLNSGIPLRGGGGHFAPQDVRWLDSVLAAIDPAAKLIFVCHHVPDGRDIDNTFAVLDLLRKRDTRFIGIGHGHSNRKYDFGGIEGVMFRSTLSRNGPAAYNIVEVREDSVIVSQKPAGEARKRPWHSFANRRRPSVQSISEEPRPAGTGVAVLWEFNAGASIGTAPATDADIVVITDAIGRVTGLSLSTGSVRWQVKAAATTIYSSPEIAGEKIVFGTSDGSIQARSKRDGELIWRYGVRGSVLSSPAIENGSVFVGTSDGTFKSLDLETGKLRWEYASLAENVETRPLIRGSKVLFGSWDGFLYSLDRITGVLAWRWSAENPNFYYAPAVCWPVAAGSKVFIVAPDKHTTSIDLNTGVTAWRTNRFPVWESIGVSEDESRIYLRGMTDTLYCLDAVGPEPTLLWKTNCGYGFDSNPSMPREKEGTVFFGSKSGVVGALDAKTGAIRWKYDTGDARTSTVTPLNGSSVLVTTMDGKVLSLRGGQ